MKSFIRASFIALFLVVFSTLVFGSPNAKVSDKNSADTTFTVKPPALADKTISIDGPVPETAATINAAVSLTDAGSLISQELAILRAQNELIKSHHSSLLSTVYFALSGLFAVAVLLVGFGWWSNFRIHDADRTRIKEETEGMISELESRVSVQLAENRTDYLSLVDSRLEMVESRIATEISRVSSSIDESDTEIKSVADGLKDLDSKTSEDIAVISNGLLMSECNLREVEEHVWQLKKVPGNVLVTQGQGIRSAVEAKDPDAVKIVLLRMKDSLEEMSSDDSIAISKGTLDLTTSNLDIASTLHPLTSEAVRELLSSIPVRGD